MPQRSKTHLRDDNAWEKGQDDNVGIRESNQLWERGNNAVRRVKVTPGEGLRYNIQCLLALYAMVLGLHMLPRGCGGGDTPALSGDRLWFSKDRLEGESSGSLFSPLLAGDSTSIEGDKDKLCARVVEVRTQLVLELMVK